VDRARLQRELYGNASGAAPEQVVMAG